VNRPIYKALASLIQAVHNCRDSGNVEWLEIHGENANQIVKSFMPSGSGWDCGTKMDWDASTPEKLVFYGEFHHMDEGGCYDGWTKHCIIVRPSLANDFDLRITGHDRNEIKEYLHLKFDVALRQVVDQVADKRGPKGFRFALVKEPA
jgi:hypothetical protein